MQYSKIMHVSSAQWHGLLVLMRPHQWLKNVFVFAPLVFTREFLELQSVLTAALAFALFSLAASATYIVNDVHDVENDRQHPVKSKSRPLAAGLVPMHMAVILLGVLYTILFFRWFVLPSVVHILVVYMLINIAYTCYLKNQPVLDIFTIAIGFVLRVMAGAAALDVPVSGWMFITTLCLALYLASIKRRQELIQSGAGARAVLKSYTIRLIDRYAELSAVSALVFYSMFVMSSQPRLVVSIPLVLFGLFRYWYIVEELQGGESPSDVLVGDRQLLCCCVLWVVVCVWVLWPGA